ncbi:DUF2599 domain-containing protein [Curtobacterium sp. A7_M15]|uniref:DUF2599 domain-containing protein n=1 Tax=Curtobacterium sp. A7_M15 TaxID=3065241 RepID=UPI002737818E|nr:DUF2599 domain-containing protein [Curtobacterium sp. A7_M15]MDP4332423.1 DUF2599 domain-containing protein [Curtobacterium sp. A7_M15]
MRSLLHAPRTRKRSLAAAILAALALIGSLLVATPAHALNNTGTGGVFVSATGRILDTKAGTGGFSTPMEAGKYRTIKVAGLAGLPDDGSVGAVSLNATVGASTGYGTLFGRPDADTGRTTMLIYNGVSGEYTSNSATIAVGADGTIQVMTETASRLILDVQGYYTANTDGTAAGGFVPVAKRLVDTRSGMGAAKAAIAPGKSIDVQITGANGVPAGASAAVVNLIAVNSTDADGYLTPYATGGTKPQNSLHYAPSETTSVQAQVPLSAAGKITIANSSTTTNLLVDLQGYFTAAGKGGAVFTPSYGRAYDSRATGNTALAKNETRSIQIAGTAGVPVMGSGITAVTLTLIVAHGGSAGYADVYADGKTDPGITAVNFQPNEIQTNTITVPLGANGKIALRNAAEATNYVVDVQGWYINPAAPTISCPQPYAAGSWTNALPNSNIACTVHMAATGDDSGTLDVTINGENTVETMLSSTTDTTYTATVPAVDGWYDITATSNYAGNVGVDTHYEFGLNHGTPSAALQAVERANPEGFENLATDAATTSTFAASTTVGDAVAGAATIANTPSGGVTVASDAQSTTDPDTGDTTTIPASTVSLALPFAQTASNATVEAPGVVSYRNNNGSSTLAVLKADTSLQLNTVISDASAPSAYSYSMSLPAGATAATQDDGSIVITDSSGGLVGAMSPAWAVDANGVPVPTHYELSGTTVTQIVDFSETQAFPVVADPWFGKALVKKVQWSYAYKNDPRLMVFPTSWGRVWAGELTWDAHWSEVLSKTPDHKSRANTNDMKLQLWCHLDLGAQFWKDSYNLDTSLHRGRLDAYTSHRCN